MEIIIAALVVLGVIQVLSIAAAVHAFLYLRWKVSNIELPKVPEPEVRYVEVPLSVPTPVEEEPVVMPNGRIIKTSEWTLEPTVAPRQHEFEAI